MPLTRKMMLMYVRALSLGATHHTGDAQCGIQINLLVLSYRRMSWTTNCCRSTKKTRRGIASECRSTG
jgi:hypothetical protein